MNIQFKSLIAVIALGSGLMAFSVQADSGISIKALTAAALRSETGSAKGPVSGRPAEMIRLVSQSNAQTMAEVKVLERYTNDCGRVVVSLIQPNALKRDGSRDTLQMNTFLNVCANGQPYQAAQTIKK